MMKLKPLNSLIKYIKGEIPEEELVSLSSLTKYIGKKISNKDIADFVISTKPLHKIKGFKELSFGLIEELKKTRRLDKFYLLFYAEWFLECYNDLNWFLEGTNFANFSEACFLVHEEFLEKSLLKRKNNIVYQMMIL